MPFRTKLAVVNSGIVLGLAWEYWRGAPVLALAITALIALPLANTLMLLKATRLQARELR